MSMCFRWFIAVFFVFSSAVFASSKSEKIDSLERQISEMTEIKRGYDGRATYHVNQAERLQFSTHELQTAKKHWILADHYHKLSNELQKKIDELETQKKELQTKH